MNETSGPKQSETLLSTSKTEHPSTPNKPQIEVASKYSSADSLKSQAAGQVPDINGEKIELPASAGMSNDRLKQQASEQRVLTVEEKKLQVESLLQQLPPDVLNAKTPEELEEKIVEDHVATSGEDPEDARKRWQKSKEGLISLGSVVAEWFNQRLLESNLHEILKMILENNFGGRSTDVSRNHESSEKLKTRGDFIDKIYQNPKKFGEALKKSYYDDQGLQEKGLKINETQLQSLIETGSVEDLRHVFASLVEFFSDGDTAQKQEHWQAFSKVFAKHLFEDDKAVLDEEVKTFIVEELVKENRFDRFFGSSKQQNRDQEEQDGVAA